MGEATSPLKKLTNDESVEKPLVKNEVKKDKRKNMDYLMLFNENEKLK